MKLKRRQAYAIRSAIHDLEKTIDKRDRTKPTERVRDLLMSACNSLWERDFPKMLNQLRRVAEAAPEAKWIDLHAQVAALFS